MPRCHLPLDVFPSNPRQPTQFRSWFHPIRSCVPQNLLVDRKAPERRSLKNLNPPPIHPYLNSVYVQLSILSTICIMCLYIYIYVCVRMCVRVYLHSSIHQRVSSLRAPWIRGFFEALPAGLVSRKARSLHRCHIRWHAILMAVTYGPVGPVTHK